jgi:hypothetical protein
MTAAQRVEDVLRDLVDIARLVFLRCWRLAGVSFTSTLSLGCLFLPQIAAKLQHEGLSLLVTFEHDAVFAVAGTKELRCESHIAERRGEPYAAHRTAKDYLKPTQERLQLSAALVPDKGMQLVDYDIFEGREQPGDLDPPAHKQCLDRFRSDQNDSVRVPACFCFRAR